MTDRQITHAPGCWGWGPRHYECALREIELLVAEWKRISAAKSEAETRAERLRDERDALCAEVERLRQALEPWANEPDVDAATMLRLIKTIKYLVGIAERGEGRKIADDETPEQFVLGYVKRLEQTNPDARAKLREKNGGRA